MSLSVCESLFLNKWINILQTRGINVNIINNFYRNSAAEPRFFAKFDIECGAHFNYSKLWQKLIINFIIFPNRCKH